MSWRLRLRARARVCNQCAGLSGWRPIADASTCMPCVLRIADRARRQSAAFEERMVRARLHRYVG